VGHKAEPIAGEKRKSRGLSILSVTRQMVLRSFINWDNKKSERGGDIEWVGQSQLGNNGLRDNDFNTTLFANLYKL
jgi:hypothetical protein